MFTVLLSGLQFLNSKLFGFWKLKILTLKSTVSGVKSIVLEKGKQGLKSCLVTYPMLQSTRSHCSITVIHCLTHIAQLIVLFRTHRGLVWFWSLCSMLALAAYICNSCTWELRQEDCGFSVILGYIERFCLTPLFFSPGGFAYYASWHGRTFYSRSLQKHIAGHHPIY